MFSTSQRSATNVYEYRCFMMSVLREETKLAQTWYVARK